MKSRRKGKKREEVRKWVREGVRERDGEWKYQRER